ncbi:putative tetratricopeptide-like helical domain superfamily [Helianthus debilis subsp. tardiflorus]
MGRTKKPQLLLTLKTNCIIFHILTKNKKFVSEESVFNKMFKSCDVSMHSKVFDSIVCCYRMCDSTPRVIGALFKTYAQMKQFRNTDDMFSRMKGYGFLPTVESCYLYMSLLLSLNRAGVVVSFYKKMRRSRMMMNVFTVNMLINGQRELS